MNIFSPTIGMREKDALEVSRANLGLAEAIGAMLTGIGTAVTSLPGEVKNIFEGEASELLRKKYDPEGTTLKPKQGVSGIDMTYRPRTEHGQITADMLSSAGGLIDKGFRAASGVVPWFLGTGPLKRQTVFNAPSAATGFTSTAMDIAKSYLNPESERDFSYPRVALGMDQATYTLLNMVNPLRAFKGLKNVYKKGAGVWAADPFLMRGQKAGANSILDKIPWYGPEKGLGKVYQIGKMIPESIYSKIMNFLNPTNDWLSQNFGMSRITVKELVRLEKVMEDAKGVMASEAKDTPPYKEASSLYDTAFNEYLNEAAKVIITGKKYFPDDPGLKNMEKGLVGHIFPTSHTAKYADVVANPELIAHLVQSKLPNELISHILPRVEYMTRGSPTTHWVTKPLMPEGGAGVRLSAGSAKAKGAVRLNPLHPIRDAWQQLVDEGLPVSGEAILERVAPHERKVVSGSMVDKDGYISFGTQSLTPDRLLAHMEHIWVVDKKTGNGVLFNVDQYKLGAGGVLDSLADWGSKQSTVVVDANNFDVIGTRYRNKGSPNYVPKSDKFEITPIGKWMKNNKRPKGQNLQEAVVGALGPKLRSKPTSDFVRAHLAETYGYQPVPLARQGLIEEEGLLSENRKTRNIY